MGLLSKALRRRFAARHPRQEAHFMGEAAQKLRYASKQGLLKLGIEKRSAFTGGEVETQLRRCIEKGNGVGIIVLETDTSWDMTADLSGLVSQSLASLGIALPLRASRCLVLIPKKQDRELIAHRLSKTLGVRICTNFKAEKLETALSALRLYL